MEGHPTLHRFRPDHAVPPGETLREVLEAVNMTQADLARRTGLSPKTVNQIVQGVAPLTQQTALALERATGRPAHVWNSLEAQYREYRARRDEVEEFASASDWLRSLPVKELQERGYVARTKSTGELVRSLCAFFGVASPQAWEDSWARPQASFRRATKFEVDTGATAAWLCIGEIEARKIDCAPFDKESFTRALHRIRRLTRHPVRQFETEAVEHCAASGVALVFVPQIKRCRASGATRWLSPSKALLQLSLRYRWEDQLWFSFFHESGHLLLHGKREVFVDDEKGDEGVDYEEEADRFAANLLIPPEHVEEYKTLSLRRNQARIKAFAKKLGISPAIVVGRLQRETGDYQYGNSLRRRFEFGE